MNLDNYVQELRASSRISASWTKVENIHLTLKFFGNVDQSKIKSLTSALDVATSGNPPIQVGVGGTGVFPAPGPAKVLWIGIVDPSHALERLNGSIENECEKEGFAKEEREFHPHLTIARLRSRNDARELAKAHLQNQFKTMKFDARELILFRSELSSEGSRYSVVSRHALRG